MKNIKRDMAACDTLPLWPEAASKLGIGRTAAYAGAARGEIPTIRIGNRILVPKAKLNELLGKSTG